jgi:hypothetical protein
MALEFSDTNDRPSLIPIIDEAQSRACRMIN